MIRKFNKVVRYKISLQKSIASLYINNNKLENLI